MSSNYTQEYYGTRKGRSAAGDIGYEMFPEKYESTNIYEASDAIYNFNRNALRDLAPEKNTLFASEEPRREKMSSSFLNLRDGGKFGSTAEPIIYDADFDTQFHDADPRGHHGEHDWKSYRKVVENKLSLVDFKDDGDYKTIDGCIHPDKLYSNIRQTQNWLKARLKIFDEGLENRHNGGVGVYDNVSSVFKSYQEDLSIAVDGTSMNMTFEDPEIRARLTTVLSNWVHTGGKQLKENSTTDHKVATSAYGKLLSQSGILNHETQMRMIADDRKFSVLSGIRSGNKNLIKVLDEMTQSEERKKIQDYDAVANQDKREFMYSEQSSKNSTASITRDILSLVGISEQQVKFLESQANKNNKTAVRALAELYSMTELVHNSPAHTKLQIRKELLKSAAGAGLKPGTGDRQASLINPKIMSYMQRQTINYTTKSRETVDKRAANADIKIKDFKNVRIAKSAKQEYMGNTMELIDSGIKAGNSKKAVNYKKILKDSSPNQNTSATSQTASETLNTMLVKRKLVSNKYREMMDNGKTDNEFGENKSFNKHGAKTSYKKNLAFMQQQDFSIKNEVRNFT